MSEQEKEKSSDNLKITQEQRAILSSLLSNLPKTDQDSISDCIKSGVEQWSNNTTRDQIFCTTCLPVNLKDGTLIINRAPDAVGSKFRDYKVSLATKQEVDKISEEVERRWIFTSGDLKGKTFDLRGDLGLSKCLFGAALYYLTTSKFKNLGKQILFDVDKKGDYLKPNDKIQFWFCYMVINHNLTGRMKRRLVTIDVNSKRVKFGKQSHVDVVKDLDQLQIEKVMNEAYDLESKALTKDKQLEFTL